MSGYWLRHAWAKVCTWICNASATRMKSKLRAFGDTWRATLRTKAPRSLHSRQQSRLSAYALDFVQTPYMNYCNTNCNRVLLPQIAVLGISNINLQICMQIPTLQEPTTDSLKIELLMELAQALYNAGFSVRRCLQPLDWAIDIILVSSVKPPEAPAPADSDKTKLTETSAGETRKTDNCDVVQL